MNAKHAVVLFAAVVALTGRAFAAQSDEAQLGQQTYDDLKAQKVIVASSPLYDALRPISEPIAKVIQPKYPYPIHFYIVHGNEPNAFAAPGGNVYVIDSLMYFVKSKEELAGTLCHETSHLLHHDSINEQAHDEAIRRRELVAAILLGPSLAELLTVSSIGNLDSLHYSRGAEEAADLTGADTCAQAGLNPWGLVWLFQDFTNANLKTPPEFLSDHPDNQHRVDALEKKMRGDPAVFGKFNPDPSSATPMKLPKNSAETFVQ
jgi:predicted Zn-dependent protease